MRAPLHRPHSSGSIQRSLTPGGQEIFRKYDRDGDGVISRKALEDMPALWLGGSGSLEIAGTH